MDDVRLETINSKIPLGENKISPPPSQLSEKKKLGDPRFEENCEFLKVMVNKEYELTDHGFTIYKTGLKITVFSFHKLLYITAILLTIIYDVKLTSNISKNWASPALISGGNVRASSEWPGTSIRHADLDC